MAADDVQRVRAYLAQLGDDSGDGVPDGAIAVLATQARARLSSSGRQRGWLGEVHGVLQRRAASRAARCRGCHEQIGATHYAWCDVGERATAVTAEQTTEYAPVEEECAHCGELRAPHEFEDGLRCVYCAERQDEPEPASEQLTMIDDGEPS